MVRASCMKVFYRKVRILRIDFSLDIEGLSY